MEIRLSDIIFIINPNSGNKNASKIVNAIKAVSNDINYIVTKDLLEFDVFFKTKATNYKVIVICGGDGTINNTIKYLYNQNDLILAILPNGSGNGFARELGFKKNISKLISQITANDIEKVDVIKINKEYSINIIGLGFDSKIASEFEKSSTRGLKMYIYHTLKTMFNYKPIRAEIELEDKTISGKYQMINIANTRQYGNNSYIAPMAKYNDQYFDIVLIKPIPLYLMPIYTYKLFKGTLKESKYIKYLKANSIRIKSNSQSYHIDGEPRPMNTPLEIAIAKTQINVIKTY